MKQIEIDLVSSSRVTVKGTPVRESNIDFGCNVIKGQEVFQEKRRSHMRLVNARIAGLSAKWWGFSKCSD